MTTSTKSAANGSATNGNAGRDHMGRHKVVITGFGVMTSIGTGKDDTWAALNQGKSGIKPITRFCTNGLKTTISGAIPVKNGGVHHATLHTLDMGATVTEEAIAQAGIGSKGNFPGPLYLAIPPAEVEWGDRSALFDAAVASGKLDLETADAWAYDKSLVDAAHAGGHRALYDDSSYVTVQDGLAETFGTKGVPISLSTACASGASAMQLGIDAIRRGESDAALCVGTDGSVNQDTLLRFSLLSALSTQNDDPQAASKPFSKNRDGFVMSEGAAAFVIESYDAAVARGAKILAVVSGAGEKADLFHRTRSKPDGSAIVGAIENVLNDAGLTPDDISYINAHGTSTPENDKMEHLGLATVFGERLKSVPISSNKSMIGHTLTAAGAVEGAILTMSILNSRVPPTINYNEPDPNIEIDPVAHKARDLVINHAMSNSFGFGGQNVSLMLSAAA